VIEAEENERTMQKQTNERSFSRPNVEGFVVPHEDAQQCLLDGPFRPVMIQDELVVFQVRRQLLEPHQSLFPHSFPSPSSPVTVPLRSPENNKLFVFRRERQQRSVFALTPQSLSLLPFFYLCATGK